MTTGSKKCSSSRGCSRIGAVSSKESDEHLSSLISGKQRYSLHVNI